MHPEMESQTMRWRCVEWWCGGEVKIRFRSHQHAIPSFLAMLKRALWCCKSYPRAISEKFGKRVERNSPPRPPRFGATFSVAFFRFSGAFRCWVLMCVCVPIFTASFRSYNFIVSNHAATPTKEWEKNWDLFFVVAAFWMDGFLLLLCARKLYTDFGASFGQGKRATFSLFEMQHFEHGMQAKVLSSALLKGTYLFVCVCCSHCVCVCAEVAKFEKHHGAWKTIHFSPPYAAKVLFVCR